MCNGFLYSQYWKPITHVTHCNFLIMESIKEVEELKVYFPDLDENQLSNCEYMYSVLSTLRNNKVKSMILKARKNRSIG